MKFEYCNFPMKIDDDDNNSIEEFEKGNGNRISSDVYGIHCEDAAAKGCPSEGHMVPFHASLFGEYVNNIYENRRVNKIKNMIDY